MEPFMELSGSKGLADHVPPEAKSRPPEREFSRSSYGRPAMNRRNERRVGELPL
jgi:hypothetical protein